MKRLVWVSSGMTVTAVAAFAVSAAPELRAALSQGASDVVFEAPAVSDRISTAYRSHGATGFAEVSVATVDPFEGAAPDSNSPFETSFAPQGDEAQGGAAAQIAALATGGGPKIDLDDRATGELLLSARADGAAGSAAKAEGFVSEWESPNFRDNPLVGTAYRADGEELSRAEFIGEASGARYVLLGEVHDNPDHHRIQADIIGGLARLGKRPEIVFEMIPQSFSDTLQAFGGLEVGDLAAFAQRLRWEERGWPAFTTYEPVFRSALSNDLAIHAGDLDREIIASIGREGVGALAPAEAERLGLSLPLDAQTREAIAEEMQVSHCGLMPEKALAGMVDAQRARDGALAAALREAVGEEGSAVLIAGAGHVRKDRGVPQLLARTDEDASTLSVRMMEVRENATATDDYGIGTGAPELYDVTIFTPQAERADPCEALRARVER